MVVWDYRARKRRRFLHRVGARYCAASPAAEADGELSRDALLMARAAGQIDRAPVVGQIDDVLIHEGPRRRIAFAA